MDDHLRAYTTVDRAQRPAQAGATQLIELVRQNVVERRIRGGNRRGDALGAGFHRQPGPAPRRVPRARGRVPAWDGTVLPVLPPGP